MKKFTLFATDKTRFKIKQKWDLSAPEVIVRNSYCYPYIKYLISSIYNPFSFSSLKSVSLNGILSLTVQRNKKTRLAHLLKKSLENIERTDKNETTSPKEL